MNGKNVQLHELPYLYNTYCRCSQIPCDQPWNWNDLDPMLMMGRSHLDPILQTPFSYQANGPCDLNLSTPKMKIS